MKLFLLSALGAALLVTGACSARRHDNTLKWSRAYIVIPAGSAPGVMYLAITNNTDAADTLLSVTTPLTPHAEVHKEVRSIAPAAPGASPSVPAMAMMHMEPVAALPIPPHSTVRFKPGGYHIMLIGPQQTLTRGDSIPVTLHFAHAGAMAGRAAVITYGDVDTAVAP